MQNLLPKLEEEEERLRSLLVQVADDTAAAAAILGQLSPDEKGRGGGEVALDQIGVVVGRLARRDARYAGGGRELLQPILGCLRAEEGHVVRPFLGRVLANSQGSGVANSQKEEDGD